MKVGELIGLLQGFHPDDDVVLWTASHRQMTLSTINTEKVDELKCCVIDCDWTPVDKMALTPEERFSQQQILIEEAKKTADKYYLARARHNSLKRKNRTKEEMLADGYVFTGKRGRPRKMIANPNEKED